MVKNMTVSLEEFYAAYQQSFEKITHKFELAGISGPVLMSPGKTGYPDQNTKLLLVGQEIRDWEDCSGAIQTAMDNYVWLSANRTRMSAFWTARRTLEEIMKIDRGCSAWTSLSKFSFPMSALDFIYREEIGIFDELLIGEAVRVRPHVAVFVTGVSNDNRLRKIFEGMRIDKVEGFHPADLVQLRHVFLPLRSYRIADPLDRNGEVDQRVLEFIAYPPYQ